jgi:opacity protein-like surface antigen
MKYTLLLLASVLSLHLHANQYLQVTVGSADPQSDGSIQNSLNVGTSLDTSVASSLEYGFTSNALPGLSFGFEYTFLSTSAQISGVTDAEDVANINAILGTTLLVGETSLNEDYDIDLFMLNFNYQYEFTDQLSLNLMLGLGMLKAEQELGVVNPGLTGNSKADDSVFAYQLGAKLGYDINDSLTLLGGVRLLQTSDLDFVHEDLGIAFLGGDADVLSFEASIRYTF